MARTVVVQRSGFALFFILFVKAIIELLLGIVLNDDKFILLASNDSLASLVALYFARRYGFEIDDDE